MSKAAARKGDATVHGGVIIEGDDSVKVGNLPAARMGDNHSCPMVTPPAHVGGPVVQGRSLVLIGNLPAAAVGDAVACNGPPDAIAVGCGNVLLGDGPDAAADAGAGSSAEADGDTSDGEQQTARFEYRLLDRDMPIRNANCRLFVDDQELAATSDGDGLIALDVPSNATTAYLLVEAEEPEAADPLEPPKAGDEQRPRWTNAGGDYRRPPGSEGESEERSEDVLEIPIVLGRLEPIDAAAGPEEKRNRAAAKQRLAQLGFMGHGAPSHFGAAVLDFQLYKGLPTTGLLDAATCQALDRFEAEDE